MAKYPVVVHGASGYTGMLIIDWLIDQRIPFTAIGRNAERVESNMRERVVRLESAEYEIVECEHDVDALAKAFSGGKVVCNTVGPFVDFGLTGVEAALRRRLPPPRHDRRAELHPRRPRPVRRRVREGEPGLRAVDVVHVHARRDRGRAGARACRASTCSRPPRSAAGRARRPASRSGRPRRSSSCCGTEQYHLWDNEMVAHEPGKGYEISVPEFMQPVFALPWGGTSLPAFYEHDSAGPLLQLARRLLRQPDHAHGRRPVAASGRPSTRTCRPSSRTRSSRSSSSRPRRKCRRASALRCSAPSTSRSAAGR